MFAASRRAVNSADPVQLLPRQRLFLVGALRGRA